MIIKKFLDIGFLEALDKALLKVTALLRKPIHDIKNHYELKTSNYYVTFPFERNYKIKLIERNLFQLFLKKDKFKDKNFKYKKRPSSEVLLRKIINELYLQNFISEKKAIIDIGSWIADNTLIWAKFLDENAFVLAVDPSKENISYGKKLAEINEIYNIRWEKAVCSSEKNLKLSFDGNLNHARFKTHEKGKNFLISTTLDDIVEKYNNIDVGFIHIDVEGFELDVLKGSKNLISRNKPVITFEQHISKEDVNEVIEYIKKYDYKIFMINEILPGCSLDCRNFLALPHNKNLPLLENFDQKTGRSLGIFSAVLGPQLIEIA